MSGKLITPPNMFTIVPCLGVSVVSVSDSWPGWGDFSLRRIFAIRFSQSEVVLHSNSQSLEKRTKNVQRTKYGPWSPFQIRMHEQLYCICICLQMIRTYGCKLFAYVVCPFLPEHSSYIKLIWIHPGIFKQFSHLFAIVADVFCCRLQAIGSVFNNHSENLICPTL